MKNPFNHLFSPSILAAFAVVFFLMALLQLQAKRTSNDVLDGATWQELTENLDYPTQELDVITSEDAGQVSNWGRWVKKLKYLIYVLIAGVFIFLIYRLVLQMKNSAQEKPQKKIVFENLEDAEENLQRADLQPALDAALQNQNYPLALRIMYLMALAHLDAEGGIQWKKDKTNRDYQIELKAHTLLPVFQKLTAAFEQTWYGKTPLHHNQFEPLQGLFALIIQSKGNR